MSSLNKMDSTSSELTISKDACFEIPFAWTLGLICSSLSLAQSTSSRLGVLAFCGFPGRRNGSVVFVPTSRSDGREFEPSTRPQPARLGETVEQQDYAGHW